MTEYGLGPSYVRIFYRSVFGRHVMTLPTRQYNPLGGTLGFGGYEAWNASNRDAETMITDLCADIAELLPDSSTFESYTIYDQTSIGSGIYVPRATNVIVRDGQDATAGWVAAVQATFTLFDTDFNTAKLVLLDVASNNDFNRVAAADYSSAQNQAPGELLNPANAWSSRAGLQPTENRHLSFTLNKKLRKQYGLS